MRKCNLGGHGLQRRELAGDHSSQITQRFCSVKHSIFCNDSQPVFNGCGQLHAAKAIEMQILGQPQFIADAEVRFAGNLSNQSD